MQELEEHIARPSSRRSHRRIHRSDFVDIKSQRERSRSQSRENALQRAASPSGPRFREIADRVASSSGPQPPLLEATQQGSSSSSRDSPIKLGLIEDDDKEVGGIIIPDTCDSYMQEGNVRIVRLPGRAWTTQGIVMARPCVDTVCRDCHTLMSREGILWDDWCRSTREGLPWSPSVRPDSPWPTGAIPLPMLSNSNTGGYSDQDITSDKSLLRSDHVAARNAARHAAGRGSEAEHSLETLAKIDPQEANPEDADLQAQHTPVQAGQGAEETDDFASEQPTSHSGRNDTEKSAHLHLSPLPVYTPPIISTGLHGGMSASSLSAGCKLGG